MPNEIILDSDSTAIRVEHPVPEYLKNLTEQEVLEVIAASNLQALRNRRNLLLAETDWTQSEDVPQETRDRWKPYRQALRDITNTYSSLDDVVWPEKPN
jgi:hypothetical protein